MEKKGLKGPRRGPTGNIRALLRREVREGQRDAAWNEMDEFYYLT